MEMMVSPTSGAKSTQYIISLEVLYLSDNNSYFIPAEIGQLANLSILSLSASNLVTLPSEIGHLELLEVLYLNNNQLVNLPLEIHQHVNLCYLSLNYNQFHNLPQAIGEIGHLYVSGCNLGVSNNPLVSPPPEVIAQGTPAILDYLNHQALWHLQRMIIGIATMVSLIAIGFYGLFKFRQSRRKPKQKRSMER